MDAVVLDAFGRHATEAAMRLLPRRRPGPRAKTARPAAPYLAAGAEQARRLTTSTPKIDPEALAAPDSVAARILTELDVR